jgi:ubiquinone/menaquinone biosynthesis C-methylase UbiE
VNSAPSFELTAEQPKIRDVGGPQQLSTAEGYERWAPIYDHAPNPLLACEERYLRPMLGDLGGRRILDLACGTGRWLQMLTAQTGASGAGIDCSSAMLRIAGRKDAVAGRLVRADCQILPFRAAAFDLAICSFSIGHVKGLSSLVRELARVTEIGAEVFVSDLHPQAYGRGWRVGFRDSSTAVQIETLPRAAEEIAGAFNSDGFTCRAQIPLFIGDPEKRIFARAGKSSAFAEVCQLPAILVSQFQRTPAGTE